MVLYFNSTVALACTVIILITSKTYLTDLKTEFPWCSVYIDMEVCIMNKPSHFPISRP